MSQIPSIAGGGSSPLSSAIQAPGGKLGKDEFLKMLVSQLRHQDPMNPMEGQEFAAQLAQFSSVEQLVSMNAQMAQQAAGNAALLQSLNSNVALSTIGRTVLAAGDQVAIPAGGGADTTVTFNVGDGGGRATLTVRDTEGVVVGTRALGVLGGGKQTVPLGAAAAGAAPGTYTYEVAVTDAKGATVPVQPYISGTVDGVRYAESGAVLTSGPLTIDVGRVLQVGR